MNNKDDFNNIKSIAMPSILLVILVCGIVGNFTVLGVGICKRKYQNNVTNCFVMNLAITDILFLLISVPLTVYLAIENTWIFGEFICRINIYLAYVLLQATCYTLAAMSIDRYFAIVHDVWYRKYRKTKYALLICILIWTVSLLFMFPYDYIIRFSTDKTNETKPVFDCTADGENSFFSSCLFTFGFYYVLPLSIIGLCYSRVLIHVRRNGYKIANRISGQCSQTLHFKRRRVQRMLCGLTFAFALCWLPIHILELLKCSNFLSESFYSKHVDLLTAARIIAHGLSYFNSCLNPFLYAILNKNYFSSSE